LLHYFVSRENWSSIILLDFLLMGKSHESARRAVEVKGARAVGKKWLYSSCFDELWMNDDFCI
jgi:hypothetical protein